MSNMNSTILDHFGIVNQTIENIGMVGTIDRCIPTKRNVSVGNAVKAMVLNGMGFVSEALYLTPMFYENKPISMFFGDDIIASDFNDDTLARSLNDLYDAGLSSVFSIVAMEAMQNMGYTSLIGHLDSSSFSFHGDYPERLIKEGDKEVRITQGYSKDHRPDLKQIVVGLICDAKTKIPMYFKALDGNKSDVSSFVPMISEFQKQLEESQMPKMIVADAALYSEDNIQTLAKSTTFLTRVPDSLNAVKELYENQDLTEMTIHSSDPRYRFQWYGNLYGGVEQQWLLIFNEALAETKSKTLERRITKEKNNLTKKVKKQSKEKFACEEDARRSFSQMANKVKFHSVEIFEITEHKKYETKGRPKADAPYVLEYSIAGKIKVAEENIAFHQQQQGFFVLATNQLDELSEEDVLSAYKQQNNTVERGFRFLKNPSFFVDALYLQKPSRIAAMLMVMTLSLLIYSLTEYHLRQSLIEQKETLPNQAGKPVKRVTLEWIFKLFHGIHLLTIKGKDDINPQQMVLNLKPIHKKILGLLGDDYVKCYFPNS